MIKVIVSGNTVGSALEFAAGSLRIELPRAFAPGAPVTLALGSDPEIMLEGRVIDVSRITAGTYALCVRPVNLRREQRQILMEALSSAPSTNERTSS
ncbi:MAG: hypothetical protein H6715_01705 [Myxococcales bacterium]|nr:hypothetical protein [Myxococcales bacterium]MCB9709012.1 hypothetical protein [Myxococcales bacterium]